MNNIKEAVKAITNIELPKDYTQLHDLSELLTIVDMGKKIDNYFDTIKNEFVNNHIKTFDEVLEYIPQSKFDKYKIFPGYINVFVPKLNISCNIYADTKDELIEKRNTIIKCYENNKLLYNIDFDDEYIIENDTVYNQSLNLYFDLSKLSNLEILQYVNKFIKYFVVDTKSKEIHMYYNDDYENNEDVYVKEYSGFLQNNKYVIEIDFENSYPELNNKNKIVTVNNSINHNYQEYIPRNSDWYSGRRTHEYKTIYTSKDIEHIFDLKTNQYLKTKVSKDKENNNTFYSTPFTFENSKYISIHGVEYGDGNTINDRMKERKILSADDFIKEIDKKILEWTQ